MCWLCLTLVYDSFVLISIFLTISSQLSDSIVTSVNGHNVNGNSVPSKSSSRAATVDRSTQTDSNFSGLDTGQDRVPLPRQVQSLQLEDALPPAEPMVEGTRAKLHRTPVLEEEDEEQEEDELGGGEQEKELSWMSSVEEPIQPTTIKGLQREDFQDGSCSPDEPSSGSSSVRNSEQNLSSRSGALSPIQEGEKKPLCVHPPPSPFKISLLIIIFSTASDCMDSNNTIFLILTCVTLKPSCAAIP